MHVIRLLLLLTTARAAKVAPLPTGAKRFLVVGQPRAGSTWLTKYSPLLARCPGVVTTGEALHPLTVERLAPQLLGNEASAPVWKSTSASGALCHFSAMTRPSWLGRAVRNRHRHAISQASRRWRGGRVKF